MFSGAKQMLLLPALLLSVLFISSCENDLNKIKEISAKQSEDPVQQTTGVDIIYSDSAKVKLRMLAPLLLQLEDPKKPEKDYDLMPKGIKIIFYDGATLKETGSIMADTGINHSKAKIIEFHKNVIAKNAQGDTFRSDELYWDQGKKIIYSNKPVIVNMAAGDIITGKTFTSDDKLTNPKFTNSNGNSVFYTTDAPQN
ncbi:MAG: LPS export ABC transporter periplasmic protein LptC [Mucilaginibacter sp.]